MGGGSYAAKQLRPLIESLGMKLTIISEWKDADVPWNIDNWQDEVKKHDIVICPTDQNKFPFKGNNKVTHFMALGMPVIATPLQSYREIIEHGISGFIADNISDWKKYLTLLRDNQDLRKTIGENAKDKVSQKYSIQATADKVLSIFEDRSKTIDIIIPNYNNTRYLLTTLESLKRNTKGLYKVAIVDSSSDDISPIEKFVEKNPDNFTLWKLPVRSCFSKQVNHGMSRTGSRWVMIGNNDLVFTKDWDVPLREYLDKNPNSMVQPLSNCDKGWLHNYELKTKSGLSLQAGIHTIDTVDIFDIEQSNITRNEIVPREKLAFYCVIFDRRLLSLIGNLDEDYLNGGEDFDFCYRAKKAGWSFASIHNSFVFHFGGKTRKVSEDENYERHHEEDRYNNTRLNRKLSKSVVAFYLGAGWEKWDENSLISGGIGGSETAAIWMAREISKFGYQVKVFADPLNDHKDSSGLDVEYIHHSKFKRYAETTFIDFLVCSRTVEPLHGLVHAYRKYVWVHDVFIGSDRRMDVCVNEVTKYLVLSEWHRDFLSDHHSIPKNKIFMTTNGIDPSRYAEVDQIQKVKGQIFYSSSPDRGLDTLLYLGEYLKDRVPNFKIKVAYGFNNWEKAVLFRNNPREVEEMKQLKEALKRPFVEFLGRIDQNQLAKVQMESSAWFYPTRFHETNCCLPDTLVSTSDGLKPIQDIKISDLVKTHTGGRFRPVSQKMESDVDTTVVGVTTKYLNKSLKMTENHPVLLLKRNSVKCKRWGNHICNQSKLCCLAGQEYKSDCTNLGSTVMKPEWLPASEINEGDFMLHPINTNSDALPYFSKVSEDVVFDGMIVGRNHRAKEISDFILDDDFLYLCGLYISEGSFDGRSTVAFAFNKNEEELHRFVTQMASRLGLSSRVQFTDNTAQVTLQSVILGRFFESNFGKGAKNKHIPQWCKDLASENLKYLLKGVFDGDGCRARDTLKLEVASHQLTVDVFESFLKFRAISILGATKKQRPSKNKEGCVIRAGEKVLDAYSVTVSLNNAPDLFKFFGYEAKTSKKPSNACIFDERYAYLPVKKIEKIPYQGKVFNLEVEEDNSYIAENLVVHNCITSIEAGWSKNAILASHHAGLITTVKDGGTLIQGDAYTKEYRQKFLDEAVRLLNDDAYLKEQQEKGYQRMQRFTWSNVAKQWHEMFQQDVYNEIQ
jgi:GT2 family glycosyltransferase/intein/homing endonuclease